MTDTRPDVHAPDLLGVDPRQFYIGGAWVDPVAPHDVDVVDPATETAIASISLGAAADVDRAVAAAQRAFDPWSQSTVDHRIAVLDALRRRYVDHREHFAVAMTREMGTPIRFSRELQAPCGDGHIETVIEALRDHRFERPSPRGGSTLVDAPVGVCGLITPWNWPVNQVIVKVVPAIAAGCTVVLKPSEESPLSALLLAQLIDDAFAEYDVPAGVFNLVNGDGLGVGAAIASHPDIDMVSFTGSTRAGIAVTHAAADTVKRVALELGGKSPNLVFADCGDDLERLVTDSVVNCFSNSGQTCDAPTRLLAERSVYDRVVDIAADVARQTEVGDPMRDGDHLGPLVNHKQFEHVQRLIDVGASEARLVAGGTGRPEGVDVGYYVRPTVFADVTNDMRIAQEEVFGPVLVIIPFDDEAGAVAIANDTPYGLSAFVQTGDDERAPRVARRLRVGQVNINGGVADYDVPFGGVKRSGNGRENGAHGLDEFLDVTSITGP